MFNMYILFSENSLSIQSLALVLTTKQERSRDKTWREKQNNNQESGPTEKQNKTRSSIKTERGERQNLALEQQLKTVFGQFFDVRSPQGLLSNLMNIIF